MSTLRHNFFFEASKNNCTNFISKKKNSKERIEQLQTIQIIIKNLF